MNRSADQAVRQGSRIVAAAARQVMATEKARMIGNRARKPSLLEQAAAEWEKEREARARKEEERFNTPRQVESYPLSPQQTQLPANSTETQDEVGWKLYNPRPEKGGGRKAATIVGGRINMAGVCALSRRLMSTEKARALGRKPMDLRAWALEQAGRRWADRRANTKARIMP